MASASVRSGMTRKEEMARMEKMYSFMRHLKICRGAELFLATIYLQRYYQRVPITSGNHQLYTCAVAVFLASRVLELHKTGTEIALRGAQLQFKKSLNTYSKEFWEWKDGILKGELIVMDTLCCDFNVYNPHVQMRRIMEKNPQNKFEMSSSDHDVVAFWDSLSTVCLPNKALSLMNMTVHTQVCLLYRTEDVMVAMMIASAIDNKLKWPKNFFATRGFKVNVPLLMEMYKYISEEQNAESRKIDFCGFGNIVQDDIRTACCEEFVDDASNSADMITTTTTTTVSSDAELKNLPTLTSPIHERKRTAVYTAKQAKTGGSSSEEHTLPVIKPLEGNKKEPDHEAADTTVNMSLEESTLTGAQPQVMVERGRAVEEHTLTETQPPSGQTRGSNANSKVCLTDSHVDTTTTTPLIPSTGNNMNRKPCAVELQNNDGKKLSPKQFKSSESDLAIATSNKPQLVPEVLPGKKPSESIADIKTRPLEPKTSMLQSLMMKKETSHTKKELPPLPRSPLTKSVNSGLSITKNAHSMPNKTSVSVIEVSKGSISTVSEEKKKQRKEADSSKDTFVKQSPAESWPASVSSIQKHLGMAGRRSAASFDDEKRRKPSMKKPVTVGAEKDQEDKNAVQGQQTVEGLKKSTPSQGRSLGSKPEERESLSVKSSTIDSNHTTASTVPNNSTVTKSNTTEVDPEGAQRKRKGQDEGDHARKLRRIIEHIDLQPSNELSDLESD